MVWVGISVNSAKKTGEVLSQLIGSDFLSATSISLDISET